VPFHAVAPVDEASGALSVGVPIYNTVVRIVGDDGQDLPPGEVGEIVTSGPMVVPGYWNKPEETEHALPGGALHTGDVGYMDAGGWFYLVDRKKDQINAGGYKVWPREVEEVLYQHEAVREAAVVGVPDAYRGETVKAFVSLRPGRTATAEELIRFCRKPPTSTLARSSSSTSYPRPCPASCCAASFAAAARGWGSAARCGCGRSWPSARRGCRRRFWRRSP
jgi:long-chain acyl-CoA synthetase